MKASYLTCAKLNAARPNQQKARQDESLDTGLAQSYSFRVMLKACACCLYCTCCYRQCGATELPYAGGTSG
jgi:hypothetical protein